MAFYAIMMMNLILQVVQLLKLQIIIYGNESRHQKYKKKKKKIEAEAETENCFVLDWIWFGILNFFINKC
jgi:hypothetical protein